MRKIKARVIKDGNEYAAYSPGAYEETFAGKTAEDGYILVPLKKNTGRNKGNSLERECAKVFSQWLYGDPRVLTRTPLSGGFNNSKLGDISGDPARLMELKLSIPKIYLEAKNREGLLSEEFFNWFSSGSPKRVTEWVIDTKRKAGQNQWWFVILKGRGTDPYVLTPWVENLVESHSLILHVEGQKLIMFPLKQLENVYLYNVQVKKAIIG